MHNVSRGFDFDRLLGISNTFKLHINVENLNENGIADSHIVETTNIFYTLSALLLEAYPNSIIPFFKSILIKDDTSQKYTVDSKLLSLQLNKIAIGDYVKYLVFKYSDFSFKGHSMVIKKTADNNFSFFDPDKGEYQNLTTEKLLNRINIELQQGDYNRAAFIDGLKYINELGINKNSVNQLRR